MVQQLLVRSRFCGPPEGGNGGYFGGLIGRLLDGPVDVSLRNRIPLDRPLEVEGDDYVVRVSDGSELIATAQVGSVDLEIPAAPSYRDAALASRLRSADGEHPYPRCFVCGLAEPMVMAFAFSQAGSRVHRSSPLRGFRCRRSPTARVA